MGDKKSYKLIDIKRGVDYIGVTCVFFCHDGKGRILMHKRSRNCRDEIGRWDCGSGSMEFGESFEKAVRREIKEEYGLQPTEIKLCGVRSVLRKNGNTKTHWIAAVFAAKVNPTGAKIGEPRKMDQIGWFRTNHLPKPLHSIFTKHLKMVQGAGIKI
ncbi:MAG: NUDIX domain-containing protein [bacterium]|nr:NUDIX domain-containing protein [bacterium]